MSEAVQEPVAAAHDDVAVPAAKSRQFVWSSGSRNIKYTATAGHVDVLDAKQALECRMFNVSYVAQSIDGQEVDPRTRPVTFCYNGGPGSSSVPINFGGIGPRRVAHEGLEFMGAGFEVEDNPGTLLQQSDLVFLDAPGTGWSIVPEGYDTKQVYSVDGDAQAFCRAIRRWLNENNRWSSPVYIYGESYGTVRNAVLMRMLGEAGVPLAGVVMLSALFDWQQCLPGADLYYEGMLPCYAATAQYFGLTGQGVDEDEWFDQASDFAGGRYARALLAGDRMAPEERREVAQQISGFIGLPVDYVLSRNLRIDLEEVRRDLLADQGKVIGRLDMRFAETSMLPVQRNSMFLMAEDPASDALMDAWAAAFSDFMRNDLGYVGPFDYKLNAYDVVNENWDMSHAEPGVDGGAVATPNVAVDIATALRRSPTTKMLIMGGRYDAATTWWNMETSISQLYLPAELKRNITFKRYGCGHMAYTETSVLMQMSADAEEFYNK